MARKWQDFERNKDRYPNLRYKTVGDSHVRDDHKTLNGFIAPIDDKIWDKIYPPNDWRCRCYVQQTDSPVSDKAPDISFMKPEFSVNVGKTGVVFNDKAHPYYNIPKTDKTDFNYAFESFKLQVSYGKAKYTSKTGAKVFVHNFADPSDLVDNFNGAKILADKGISVKITPHINRNIIPGKNPEYEIFKLKADKTDPEKPRGIVSAIDYKVNDQGAELVVLDLISNYEDNRFNAARAIKGAVNKNKKTKHIIVIFSEGDVLSLSRAEILSDNYWSIIMKKSN